MPKYLILFIASIAVVNSVGAGETVSGTVRVSEASFVIGEPSAGDEYRLPHRFLFGDSETVTCTGEIWSRGTDYAVNYDDGLVRLIRPGPYDGPVEIDYSYLPYFQDEAYTEAFEGAEEAAALERIRKGGVSDSSFEISGSKTFTVSGGTDDKDVSLDQSLRLSIDGNVANKVRVTGEISDQSLPVEETGATEEVSELDKISLRVETRNLAATFGDLDLSVSGNRYASYEKRVIGLHGEADYPLIEVDGYGARSRGRFATNEFYGIDGVQGPYRLTAEGTDDILVLPGTERVWVNGVPKEEGEGADYIMDYDNAVLSFTEKTVVTSIDRIVVDFEYYTENYRRDSFGSSGGFHLAADRYNVGYVYAHEGDDIADPLFAPTKEEMYSLIHAGDDPERARTVATDDEGNVIYEYVGAGNGSYTREWNPDTGEYVYTFVGEGNGDFDPKVVMLPLPISHDVFDVSLDLTPVSILQFTGEGAVSEYDANTYSPLEDYDNAGAAGTGSLSVHFHSVGPVGDVFDRLTLTGYTETRDRNFASLERNDPVSFARDWDIADETTGLTKPPEYRLYGGALSAARGPVSGSVGRGAMSMFFPRLSAGGYSDIDTTRYYGELSVSENPVLSGDYGINILNKDGVRRKPVNDGFKYKYYEARDTIEFREQTGELERKTWRFVPYVKLHEEKEARDRNRDGSMDDGLHEYEAEVGTSFAPAVGLSIRYGHVEGRGKKVSGGTFAPYYVSRTEKTGLTYGRSGLLNVGADYTRIRKSFAPGAEETNAATDVGKVNALYMPFDGMITARVRYEADSSQSFDREEYFEVAPDGDGDYVRYEDPNNPGRFIYIYDPDDPEAIWVKRYRNTGRTFPTTEAELLADFFIEPYRWAERRRDLPPGTEFWLNFFSVETYIRIREKSKGTDRLGILTFIKRMNAKTVIGGLDQRYTVKLFPVSPRFTLKTVYSDYENLDRSISYRELLSWRRSISVEALSEPVRRVSLRGKVERLRDREKETEENVPAPDIKTATEWRFLAEPGYNLTNLWEVKLAGELAVRREDENSVGTDITTKIIRPSTIYRLKGSGNVSVEYEREQNDVSGSKASDTLLLRIPGTTHRWEVEVLKGVGDYVTLIFTYNAEKEPEKHVEHRGQVDLQILF
ncbi:MAG: hypothetical protein JSW52_11050 [Candidatus Coatesbacteria bacterium]|nr:MAG: hypothetical protein JSW52_11050 [Candidatus Coatesbacteria bacterium]